MTVPLRLPPTSVASKHLRWAESVIDPLAFHRVVHEVGLRLEGSFEVGEGELAELGRVLAAVPMGPGADALAHVVVAFGDDVAGAGEELPFAVVDVVAVGIERDLALNFYFAIVVALADGFGFAARRGGGRRRGVGVGVLGVVVVGQGGREVQRRIMLLALGANSGVSGEQHEHRDGDTREADASRSRHTHGTSS